MSRKIQYMLARMRLATLKKILPGCGGLSFSYPHRSA